MIRTYLKLTYYENMMPRVYNQLDYIYTKYRQPVFSLNKNTQRLNSDMKSTRN